jgi:hypothetical protein
MLCWLQEVAFSSLFHYDRRNRQQAQLIAEDQSSRLAALGGWTSGGSQLIAISAVVLTATSRVPGIVHQTVFGILPGIGAHASERFSLVESSFLTSATTSTN